MPIKGRRTKQSERNRRRALEVFLGVAGGRRVLRPEEIEAVFTELERRYKKSYVALIFRTCKSEFASWWPKDIRYTYSQLEVKQETMPPADVQRLVYAAKTVCRDPNIRAQLFMATVYGLRREEIIRVDENAIDLAKRSLFVSTAKGGRERYHLIPNGCERYLTNIVPVSLRTLHDNLVYLMQLAGVEHVPGRCWHSLRRSLVTELNKRGLDPIQVNKFMRWAEGSMYEHYVTTDYRIADSVIFANHPFLRFWTEAFR